MKISKKDRSSFTTYLKPLQLLEKAFQSAGILIVFEARDWPAQGKTVYISHPAFPKKRKVISIEGVYVCQAVKDVAALAIDLIQSEEGKDE